jgi:hypothetical protein
MIMTTEGDRGDATTTTAASPCLQGGRGNDDRREGRQRGRGEEMRNIMTPPRL